jgi:hypothetical protein
LVRARGALEQGVALDQPQHHALTPLYGGLDPKVLSLDYTARALWFLGYPEQARTRVHEALRLAQEISHSSSLVCALGWTSELHFDRGKDTWPRSARRQWWRCRASRGFPTS